MCSTQDAASKRSLPNCADAAAQFAGADSGRDGLLQACPQSQQFDAALLYSGDDQWLVFPHEINGLTREEILANKPVDESFFTARSEIKV